MTDQRHASIDNTPTTAPMMRTPAAARHVGLAAATLTKLRCVGGGPVFTRLGRAIVYHVNDLESWVASQGKHSSTADERRPGIESAR